MKTRKAKKVEAQIDQKTGEIIDGVEESVKDTIEKAHVYLFKMPQLVMKNGRWEMHINVLKSLPLVSRNYNLMFQVNLDPLDEQIDLCLKRMEKGGQTKIDGSSEENEEHQRLLNAKEELIENCPEIELIASVIKSEFHVGETRFVFLIPPEIINKLNDRRKYIEHYKLRLSTLNLRLEPTSSD